MIKDLLVSFTDNFNEKTRNPFLGTYLLVWIIRNWELIYTLFNFDSDCNLNDKKDFIFNYYKQNPFVYNLFINILWSFGLLILTYLLINLSRFIVNLFEKKLTPWIYKVTDNSSIVLKETYEKLRNENNILELNLEKERESKGKLQIEISKLEKRIDESNIPLNLIDNKKTEDEKTEGEIDLIIKKINFYNWNQNYIDFAYKVKSAKDGWLSNSDINEICKHFITLGLIDIYEDNGTFSKLTVTDLGKNVLKRVSLEDDNYQL